MTSREAPLTPDKPEPLTAEALLREAIHELHAHGPVRDHHDVSDTTGWNVHGIETCGYPLCVDAVATLDAEPLTCVHVDTWFDRTICACGSMHNYCIDCGTLVGECAARAGVRDPEEPTFDHEVERDEHPTTGDPEAGRRCIFAGCVATWEHYHDAFPGGYDNPADPEGPPIPFTGPDPEPGAVRDYNGAVIRAATPADETPRGGATE